MSEEPFLDQLVKASRELAVFNSVCDPLHPLLSVAPQYSKDCGFL